MCAEATKEDDPRVPIFLVTLNTWHGLHSTRENVYKMKYMTKQLSTYVVCRQNRAEHFKQGQNRGMSNFIVVVEEFM